MNRKQSYEEAISRKADELPLPDEDSSWQMMRTLLDEKDDRKLALFWRWGAMIVLCLILGGLAIRELARQSGDKKIATVGPSVKSSTPVSGSVHYEHTLPPINKKAIQHGSANPGGQRISIDNVVPASGKNEDDSGKKNVPKAAQANAVFHSGKTKVSLTTPHKTAINDVQKGPKKSLFAEAKAPVESSGKWRAGETIKINSTETGLKRKEINLLSDVDQPGSSSPGIKTPETQPASSGPDVTPPEKRAPADFNVEKPSATPKQALEKDTGSTTPQNKKIIPQEVDYSSPRVAIKANPKLFSAGVSMQHPIRFSGQQSVAYGYNASGLASDYIPSVWFRYERPNRFFLQGEFIYSAPQLVKEFTFSRQTKQDTGRNFVTTSLHLKKTFFNQIPLSFNYYLRRNWSVGAGVGYAWLKGAVTQRDVVNNGPQGQTLVKREVLPVNGFTDSFLYRSHSLVLLQTEYKWNRLSAGIKYTHDLQSFITYTAPDGQIIDKKNAALTLLVRFRIWQK